MLLNAANNSRPRPRRRGLPTWRFEDLQLVPKDHELDVAVELIGGARHHEEQTTQQQVHEREEQGPNP
jgi:hypothetical protein